MEGADGWPAAQVFSGGSHALSFDEFVVMPGTTAGGGRREPGAADLSTRFTKNIPLRTPFIGGPSRSSTEVDMAVRLALLGGIGIIHGHQGIRSQVQMVTRVKQFEAGFVLDPPTLAAHHTVQEARALQAKHNGRAVMVTHNGKMGGKLAGIACSSDLDSASDPKTLLSMVMTGVGEAFVCLLEPVTLPQARQTMQETKVSCVPVINEDKELVAVVCRSDMRRNGRYPLANRDANKRLLVAAAVAGHTEDDFLRASALLEGGADALVLDTEDGVTHECVEFLKRIKEELQGTDVLVGPVSSAKQAKLLLEAGADGLRVGHPRSGARGNHGEASILYEIAEFARNTFAAPICFDGGSAGVGHILKALCLGAHTVCVDTILDALDEAPGDHIYRAGLRVKVAPCPDPALAHLGKKKKNETTFPSVSFGGVPMNKGSVDSVMPVLRQGLQRGLADLGLRNILAVGPALLNGTLRFERVRPPSIHEPDMTRPVRLLTSTLHNRW